MSTQPELDERAARAALAEAARQAGHAPSIHNTQPWRWRVGGRWLDLLADRGRQLAASDEPGRMLTISCGAALHHARVALAAEGWSVAVERFPDAADSDLLARLTSSGRTDVTPAAMRLLQAMYIRHTDRRPVVTTAPAEMLEMIRRIVEAEGAHLHLLRRDDIAELAAAAGRADVIEHFDPQWREEMAYWAGGSRDDGLGVPDAVIPSRPPATTVPGRDFGRAGSLPISSGHDRAATYAILYGDEDMPPAWLRAGEALSAAWLTATEAGATVLPLSAAIEVAVTRQTLHRMLSGLGEPLLVLRFGGADPDHAGPPHTPRLPAEQTVEVIGD